MAKVQNPTITKNDMTFHLKEIPALYQTRFMSDYEKKNPKPVPPMRAVKYVGKVENLEPDTENEYYKQQKEDWDRSFALSYTDFMICMGVMDNPPADWQPAYSFENELSEKERKVLWVGEFFPSQDELNELSEAIQSINTPTAKGLEVAEKN